MKGVVTANLFWIPPRSLILEPLKGHKGTVKSGLLNLSCWTQKNTHGFIIPKFKFQHKKFKIFSYNNFYLINLILKPRTWGAKLRLLEKWKWLQGHSSIGLSKPFWRKKLFESTTPWRVWSCDWRQPGAFQNMKCTQINGFKNCKSSNMAVTWHKGTLETKTLWGSLAR